MRKAIILALPILCLNSGCHEHCGPDDTAALQDHVGTVEITGSVTALVDGSDIVMDGARSLIHCVPTATDDFCFFLSLPPIPPPGVYDLAQIDATARILNTNEEPPEVGSVSGTLIVHEYEVHREDGGGGEGDADLNNELFRATLTATLEFPQTSVSIQLEIDFEDQAELECYSHLIP